MRGHVRSRWELSYGTDLAEVYRQVGVYTGSAGGYREY
jgi:hypothetical protein